MFWRKKKQPDYASFMEAVSRTPFGERFNPLVDTPRDFRKVFLGSPEGKRVLYTILAHAGLYTPELAPLDPNELNRVEGRRELARHIVTLCYGDVAEPMETATDEDA